MKDSGRDKVQDMTAAAEDDGVSRVVAALISSDAIKAFGEDVDDLPLTFVTPLRANHRDVHRLIIPSLSPRLKNPIICSAAVTATRS